MSPERYRPPPPGPGRPEPVRGADGFRARDDRIPPGTRAGGGEAGIRGIPGLRADFITLPHPQWRIGGCGRSRRLSGQMPLIRSHLLCALPGIRPAARRLSDHQVPKTLKKIPERAPDAAFNAGDSQPPCQSGSWAATSGDAGARPVTAALSGCRSTHTGEWRRTISLRRYLSPQRQAGGWAPRYRPPGAPLSRSPGA